MLARTRTWQRRSKQLLLTAVIFASALALLPWQMAGARQSTLTKQADKVSSSHAVTLEHRADQPTARTDAISLVGHSQLVAKAQHGGIDVHFEGDSIARRWGAVDYPELLANWKQNFFGWNAADFGWGGDQTQHILWRLENGELDGVNPKVVVLLAGTNNVGELSSAGADGGEEKAADVVGGLRAIMHVMQEKAPGATIIVMGIFPRNDHMEFMPVIERINRGLAKVADGGKIRYLNINDKLADRNGKLLDGMMIDKLHPTVKGYQVWADALKPIFTELLGPPAAVDHAPAATGIPTVAH